jgi:1-phosphatidylinositol-4-phosphate 5-kinase
MQGIMASVPAAAWVLIRLLCKEEIEDHQSCGSGEEFSEKIREKVVEKIRDAICLAARKYQSDDDGKDFAESVRLVSDASIIEARAPNVFHTIRKIFNIDPDVFEASVKEDLKENVTEGKSGAFMYFTADKRFLIKTATSEEFALLCRILPDYLEHCKANPNTLINPMLGAYTLKIFNLTTRVIVFQSAFWSGKGGNFRPTERFDLKGSWVGRHMKVPKQIGLDFLDPKTFSECRKDMDIHEPLSLESVSRQILGEQITKDCTFLAKHNIIDYSLLLGVKREQIQHGDKSKTNKRNHHAAAYVEGPTEYCMGIIDVLQDYNCRKWLEYFFLTYLTCKGPGVSCQPPEKYAQRFIDKLVKGLIKYDPDFSSTPKYSHHKSEPLVMPNNVNDGGLHARLLSA